MGLISFDLSFNYVVNLSFGIGHHIYLIFGIYHLISLKNKSLLKLNCTL